MFEGLNAIPWAKLTHAYGSAEEVPMWLRRLTSDDAKVRKEAMNDLSGSIYHQGGGYTATPYAVPFLIELLQAPGVHDKDEILDLLADIALCWADWIPEDPEHVSRQFAAQLRKGRVIADRAHEATRAGIPTYVALLNDEDAMVRMQASHVLAAFPEHAAEIQSILEAAYERETDERVRANLVLGLGQVFAPEPQYVHFLEDIIRSGESELIRFVAALALAGLAKEETPQELADVLVSVMQHGEAASSAYGAYEELPCGAGRAWYAARRALYELGPAR